MKELIRIKTDTTIEADLKGEVFSQIILAAEQANATNRQPLTYSIDDLINATDKISRLYLDSTDGEFVFVYLQRSGMIYVERLRIDENNFVYYGDDRDKIVTISDKAKSESVVIGANEDFDGNSSVGEFKVENCFVPTTKTLRGQVIDKDNEMREYKEKLKELGVDPQKLTELPF